MKFQKKITTVLIAVLVWISGGTKSLLNLAADSAHNGGQKEHKTGSNPKGGGATCE